MLALHNKCLTRRNLLGHLDLLEGLLGFVSSVLHALEGLSKLILLHLEVMLQGLKLLAEILELLLYLSHPSNLLLALGALHSRLGFGYG